MNNVPKQNDIAILSSTEKDTDDSKGIILRDLSNQGNKEIDGESSINTADSFFDDGDEETVFLADEEEETMVLNDNAGDEETMPLFPFKPNKPRISLIRRNDGEIFELIGSPITIGSSSDKADYNITSNRRVSRNHAVISQNRESFSIKDNSMNGTFVNGEKLEANQSIPIMDGDTISLADEEFTVRITQPGKKF